MFSAIFICLRFVCLCLAYARCFAIWVCLFYVFDAFFLLLFIVDVFEFDWKRGCYPKLGHLVTQWFGYIFASLFVPTPLLVCAASSVGRRIVIMVVCDWLRSVQSIKYERAQTVFSLLLLAAGNFCCCWPIDLSSLRVASSIFWTHRFVRNRGLPGFTPLLSRRTMGWPIATITMNIYK